MSDKPKRKWCYIMHPSCYEIAGCPVHETHRITWSEYEKHLWCYDCQQDFIPEHAGIFDGPIPINLAGLLGITFDRLNLETGLIETFDKENGEYVSPPKQPSAEEARQ